jgi:maltooligosyltrehalose trehalohydrolase
LSATFTVWAPDARTVELVLADRRVPMAAGSGGHWSVTLPDAQDSWRYRFSVDGKEPRPDPRSLFQPEGVHGPSAVVDHSTFCWTDGQWSAGALAGAVFYEIHVGTFSAAGTFDGAVEHLDHLVDLGVTHVEIMPVAEFPGTRGWGYDGTDLYAVHHAYGGPDGLKRFVDASHARGLAVVLDVVYNHLGPSGNYLGEYGPYFTDRFNTPWGRAVNLDGAHSDEVRRFFVDNALMWLRDYHIDGLRLDAVHAIVDTSAKHFLEQLAEEVRSLETDVQRPLVVVAESDLNDPRIVNPTALGGYGLHAQWSDDLHHAIHAVLTGERFGYYEDFGTLAHLAKALTSGFVYDGAYSTHRKRRHGRLAQGLSGHHFVVGLQTHDQVGNRAKGDRIGHVVDVDGLLVGSALVLTSPFVPLLFQGEEWGASSPFPYFTDHEEPWLADAIREGRRREFAAHGWRPEDIPDPQSPETHQRARLDWNERGREPHSRILDWYKRLVHLRRTNPALGTGRLDGISARFDENDRWLLLDRGNALVVSNLGARPTAVPLLDASPRQILLASQADVQLGSSEISMPPRSVALLAPG